MKITISITRALQELIKTGSVALSKMPVKIADMLLENGLITKHMQGSRGTYQTNCPDKLEHFIDTHLSEWRIVTKQMTKDVHNEALLRLNDLFAACPGMLINAYHNLTCNLCNAPLCMPAQTGTLTLVTDFEHFNIPTNVVVVGIEEPENFMRICEQQSLFEKNIGTDPLLFVLINPQNNILYRWLQRIPNRYVHFGNFDHASIYLFLNNYFKITNNRASFLIPNDIAQRIALSGNNERYNSQYIRYAGVHTSHPELQQLIDTINKHHKTYLQEGYLKQPYV